MQYILTEQEYRALTPISEVDKLRKKIELLNDKVMELSDHTCRSGVDYGNISFYCDDCPISGLNLDTCMKNQQYSK